MAYIGWILYANLIFITGMYLYLFQYRKLIGFQLGMNIAIVAGGLGALTTGILLIYQFPFHFVLVTIFSTLTGIIIGSLFGGMFDYQTLLTGYGNGMLLGLMAPMIGAAATNSLMLVWFLEGLLLITYAMIAVSIRRS